jgi:hypothetical protein
MGNSNLLYHVGCLFWQLGSNYALLNSLDEQWTETDSKSVDVKGGCWGALRARPLALSNTVLWGMYLLSTGPTPPIVKAATAVSLLGAHRFLGQFFASSWKKIVYLQVIIEMGVFSKLFGGLPFRIPGIGFVAMRKPVPLALYFLLRTALCKVLSDTRGKLVSPTVGKWLNRGLMGLMLAAGLSKGRQFNTLSMGLYGWIIALITDSPSTYFWSCGMLATYTQGWAHAVVKERPTLALLNADPVDQTAYEFSHVTYFPNLVWQACWHNITGVVGV